MTDGETLQQNPRKRRRPALSCEQCRRRKVRCDREMPCGPCTRAHPPLSCEYVNEGKALLDAKLDNRGGQGTASPTTILPAHDQLSDRQGANDRARIAQLEQTVQALQNRVRDLEQGIQGERSGTQRLTLSDNDAPRRSGDGVDERIPDVGHANIERRPNRLDQPQTMIAPLAPRLKSTGERVKLFGTTHWALGFQQVRPDCHSDCIPYIISDGCSYGFCVKCALQPVIMAAAQMISVDCCERFGLFVEASNKSRTHNLRTLLRAL